MLLRFGVSNYRSIKDYQEISLMASSLKEEPSHLLSHDAVKGNVLPAIGIYGANASGKSNMLKAFNFMIKGILESQVKGTVDGGVTRNPFKLKKKYGEEPSSFDCDFILEDTRYHYGFKVDNKRVLEEWLFAYPAGKRQSRQVWFHRNIEEEKEYSFSEKYLRGQNKVIESLTRDNSLFLSAAAQNNHEKLTPIYNYFRDHFKFRLHPMGYGPGGVPEFLEDESVKQWVLDFLWLADTGIADMRIKKVEVPKDTQPLMTALTSVFKKHLPDDEFSEIDKVFGNSGKDIKTLNLGHAADGEEVVYFDLQEESMGTKALLSILGPVYMALRDGCTLIVDEVDSSMHTKLSKRLLALFNNEKANKNCAQLIFTTHDTNLLCEECIRRDEVWFTEKDAGGATHAYPLTQYRVRKNDNLEKGYVQGRFGGVPLDDGLDVLFERFEERA